MSEPGEQIPILHPALQKYPSSPTALVRVDGVLYQVPMQRDLDEAVGKLERKRRGLRIG